MAFTFIHTADWQLGKRFGQFPEAAAALLRDARVEVISRIAQAATENNVRHILVAGDVWDSATPSNRTLRQPLAVMGESPDLTWWLLPGNHDPDGPDGLWGRVEDIAPETVRVLREPKAVEMEAGVYCLPAPWQRIQHGQDLTQWMDAAETPDGALRIGLAHGAVKGFGTEGDFDREIIPPNRYEQARLDYMALGDWHGRSEINARTFYAGTPEPDRHKAGARGQVLLVTLEAGVAPIIRDLPVAQFDWPVISLKLSPNEVETALTELRQKLSDGHALRRTHAQINLSGEVTVSDWTQFETEIDVLRGECASLTLRGENNVSRIIIPEDIAALDAQGSVRDAAQILLDRQSEMDLSKADRDIAGDALQLLLRYGAEEV